MKHHKRFAVTTLLLGSLGFGLGCSGLADSLVSASGSEISTGDDAQMPADYPLPAPPGHEKPTSVIKMPMGELTMVTVTFEMDDAMVHEAFYTKHFRDAGVDVTTETSDVLGTKTVVLAKQDQSQSVVLSQSYGSSSVSLVTMTKTGPSD